MVCAISYIPLHFEIQGHVIGLDIIGIAFTSAYYLTMNLAFGVLVILLSLEC